MKKVKQVGGMEIKGSRKKVRVFAKGDERHPMVSHRTLFLRGAKNNALEVRT